MVEEGAEVDEVVEPGRSFLHQEATGAGAGAGAGEEEDEIPSPRIDGLFLSRKSGLTLSNSEPASTLGGVKILIELFNLFEA